VFGTPSLLRALEGGWDSSVTSDASPHHLCMILPGVPTKAPFCAIHALVPPWLQDGAFVASRLQTTMCNAAVRMANSW
jgi:hypothetical protein